MNSLLKRLTAADSRAGFFDVTESERAFALLEWPRVVEQIADHCTNESAAEQIRHRRPYLELAPLKLHWQLADELRPPGEAGRWPPVIDVTVAMDLLARSHPAQHNGEELVHLAGVAEALDALRDFFDRERAQCPVWGEAARELETFGQVTSEIRRALERDGSVSDKASPLLARLRKACATQERGVRQAVDRAMREAQRRGWTTASEVTLRDDRYCLPLRSGDGRKLDGIIHARSSSGGTLFVEPAEVVRLHNELVELRLEAASEEQRIILALNRLVERLAPAMSEACEFLALVDQVRAGLLWSKAYCGTRPRLIPGGRLRLCEARHPLLVQYGPRGFTDEEARHGMASDRAPAPHQVVPLDLELPVEKRIMVLSGPNAGGKSVALKTVGVCVLLAQCGWDVPAREDTELPLVQQLFVDLGDEQSIEKSLSSFSAHLGHLVRFLVGADPNSLVLCDEIGGGTDPQEGTALAFSVLERLAAKGTLVLASTHFGLLKAAVHEHPDMINAAMDYDEQSFQPLFTLRLGVPGSSHAFDIADRWGFPSELLSRARSLVGEERFQIEQLLSELGRRTRDLAATEMEMKQSMEAQQQRERELSTKLTQLDKQKGELLAETRRQGEELLREGRKAIENAVRDIRSQNGDSFVIKKARDSLNALGRRLPEPPLPPSRPPIPKIGQHVHIPHLGISGRVVEIRGEKIVADAGGMRLTLSRAALVAAAESTTSPDQTTSQSNREASWRWHDLPPEVHHEIDLRGHRSEEAWDLLDRLIDRAIPAGLKEILVIHGIGTGRLRAHLHERLNADPRVSFFRAAEAQCGGHGATVVVISDI